VFRDISCKFITRQSWAARNSDVLHNAIVQYMIRNVCNAMECSNASTEPQTIIPPPPCFTVCYRQSSRYYAYYFLTSETYFYPSSKPIADPQRSTGCGQCSFQLYALIQPSNFLDHSSTNVLVASRLRPVCRHFGPGRGLQCRRYFDQIGPRVSECSHFKQSVLAISRLVSMALAAAVGH